MAKEASPRACGDAQQPRHLPEGAECGAPAELKFGFIHPEPYGALAIDQKGGGSGLKQTRLYTYPQKSEEILHLIIVGDKSSQKSDIEFCSQFVKRLIAESQD